MSRYQETRFRGVVKKEFREIFAPIALEGKWKESSDKVLREFGEEYPWESVKIPNADYPGKYYVKRWNETPWEKSWDEKTGVWQFQFGINVYSSYCVYDFEEEILPYLMESVEHYETWLEPVGDEPYSYGTCLEKLIDGELEVVGWFHEDGTFEAKEDEHKRIEEKGAKS